MDAVFEPGQFTVYTALFLVVLGFAVGVLGTIVGAGGAFMLTPILLLLYPSESAKTLTAISLTAVFFNAGSGSIAYARQRRIDLASGLLFAAAAVPGAVAGALFVGSVPRRYFDLLVALMLALLAVWLLAAGRVSLERRSRRKGATRDLVDRSGRTYHYTVALRRGTFYSTVVGFISSFLGLGGGVIHVSLLVAGLGFPTYIATATSHFVVTLMAAGAVATHVVTGSFAEGGLRRAGALSVGIVLGAQLGAYLSHRIAPRWIHAILIVALLALALRLALEA